MFQLFGSLAKGARTIFLAVTSTQMHLSQKFKRVIIDIRYAFLPNFGKSDANYNRTVSCYIGQVRTAERVPHIFFPNSDLCGSVGGHEVVDFSICSYMRRPRSQNKHQSEVSEQVSGRSEQCVFSSFILSGGQNGPSSSPGVSSK